MITGVGAALERRVDRVHKEEKDKRPDLYALAMGYAGQLKARKCHWLQDHVFHYVPPVSVLFIACATLLASEVAWRVPIWSCVLSDIACDI